MAIRDKIAKSAQPHLEPGEQIQVTFVAQTASQWWILLAVIIFVFLNNYRTVVVTDRRILVCDSGKWMTTKAKSVVHVAPRPTQLGPPVGVIFHKTSVLGEELKIHRRFHKDVVEADRLAGFVPAPPTA